MYLGFHFSDYLVLYIYVDCLTNYIVLQDRMKDNNMNTMDILCHIILKQGTF